ncbi:superoxide dismutase family protein [Flavobacterium algicola]|uniref:superoxide dismutase family protein n=1 Tax=Flavobacterium algicola TaxID=556529 RepID=UPI001EFC8CEC|nr:superoxide dismutase family protein [Flavobacterium algicola]MCG9792430.1 superoxide dismutase family protein [Flavobacterium algicola]
MKKIVISAVLILAVIIGCKTSSKSNDSKKLSLTFEAKSGSSVAGTATFTQKDGEVTLVANFTGLTPGVHAIHIHEKSDCSAADGTSTGGHWNPTFKNHGKWGVGDYHKGDIGNFTADENGKGSITFTTDEWDIGSGDPTRDILNHGIIVHKGKDDFTTQPTGDAGGRVACTGIIK